MCSELGIEDAMGRNGVADGELIYSGWAREATGR